MNSNIATHSTIHNTYPPLIHVGKNLFSAIGRTAILYGESITSKRSYHIPYSPSHERLSHLGLDDRDFAILSTVADCRLITTHQIQRLHFIGHKTPITGARVCRKVLQRLTEQKILGRLRRRIGGVRHGSASYVYRVGTVGAKLLATDGKPKNTYTTDPSDYFFEHTLELAELYTGLFELAAEGKLHLLEVQTEPSCWRLFPNNGKLFSDMFIRTIKDDIEYRFFLEVDRGTTHMPAITKKLQSYERYFNSQIEQSQSGLFPKVLWIVPDEKRSMELIMAIRTCQIPNLFTVKPTWHALPYLCNPD